jgi:hypothetical protein
MDLSNPWVFLWVGYLLTVVIETPALVVGLSPRHSLGNRLLAGVWLTACTYPIVVLVLPVWFPPAEQRLLYLAVAETFAPVAECALFAAAFGTTSGGRALARDFAVIVVANLASFAGGELIFGMGWL